MHFRLPQSITSVRINVGIYKWAVRDDGETTFDYWWGYCVREEMSRFMLGLRSI